ncbi:MAG: hypothetical protein UR98_C0003G0052 [Parcubacteria group bacterium GW2011_GWA1_36_12]|nr:MAG: hypothetical protein UR98_C0003G0052 [Parcubacteria group bacterium GW2011_GWA1_36_12]
MEKKKIILSLIGLGALIIPVVLLIFFTNRSAKRLETTSENRSINPETVQEVVRKIPTPAPVILPSPSPATVSAELELEGSPSAQ